MKYSYKVFIFIWTIILLFFLLYFGYSEISEKRANASHNNQTIKIRNTTKAKHNKNRYPKMFKNRNNYMHKQPYDFHTYPTSFGQ